jgi:hypothetical protein
LAASDVKEVQGKLTGVQGLLAVVIILQLLSCWSGLGQPISAFIIPAIMIPFNLVAFLFVFHVFRVANPAMPELADGTEGERNQNQQTATDLEARGRIQKVD